MTTRVRRRVFAAAVQLLLAAALALPAAAQAPGPSKWFRYGATVEQAWDITANPAKPMRFSITRKGMQLRKSSQRVLVLYPRPSSAYDVAITKILQVFEVNRRYSTAEFLLVNRKKTHIGLRVLLADNLQFFHLIISAKQNNLEAALVSNRKFL